MLIRAKAVIKIHVHNTLLRLVSLAQLSVIKLSLPVVSVLPLLYITVFKNSIFNLYFIFSMLGNILYNHCVWMTLLNYMTFSFLKYFA